MDYAKLRAAALRDGEDEEAVTVDTRALIDKVLARYSGEWTTLRELIQNAADAQATTVKIKWETLPSTTVPLPSGTAGAGGEAAASNSSNSSHSSNLLRHTILHHTLRRLLVENDGQPFTSTDWARLKRIAEGNPDETKIGAFGVGFYSVFADCEEPFVRSGREAMAFYWKGNALFTRKLVLPEENDSGSGSDKDNTTFVLDYRNGTTALPNLLSVSQFLATSLTFVALQRIEFWIDDWKILDLHKKLSSSTSVTIPRDLVTRTRDGLMTVAAVDRSSAQIDAVYMNAVAWKPPSGGAANASSAAAQGGGGSGGSGASNSTAVGGSGNKSTDSYGLSAGDLPSLRNFFSRLTGSSSSSSSSAQSLLRNKVAREEKAAQDALQQNLTGRGQSTIFLRVTSADVKTKVAANFATELERATKKPPPKTTKMAILTSTYDDVRASDHPAGNDGSVDAVKTATAPGAKDRNTGASSSPLSSAGPAADIFASVLPSKKPGGRIFIGFPTMQTTGGGLHVSAPSLIPTVEREAIDLNARWVRNWNMELLRVSGILTRLAFINEMADLDAKFRRHLETTRPGAVKNSRLLPLPSAADVALFVPEALHILKTYTFGDSTPSAYVGQIIEEAFWTAYQLPSLDIFSSRGVLSTTRVRMGNEAVSKFVDGIPVVVPQMKDCVFVQKLHEFGIVQDVTIDDVRSELESKPLNKEQLTHFVKWLVAGAVSDELDPPSVHSLLRVAVASVVEDGDSGKESSSGDAAGEGRQSVAIIELRTVQTFLAGNKIPANLPLPPSTIPYSITSAIPVTQLQALGWKPLELVPWLDYLITARARLGDERNIARSAAFAAQVLNVLSKNWDNLSASHKTSVVVLLNGATTIPTKMGMKKPPEAFFPSVKLFDDLPVLSPSCHHLKDKFLVALGVRKTIDLDTIFTRLLSPPAATETAAGSKQDKELQRAGGDGGGGSSGSKKWSHVELVKYLASVRSDIPSADMAKLRDSPICPAEAGPAGLESTVPTAKLFRPSQLFEPSAALRELGFPILQWPGSTSTFRRTSPEAKFLVELGLRLSPTGNELLEKMASPDRNLREKARAYFIANHQINGYSAYRLANTDKAFLPILGGAGEVGGGGGSSSSIDDKQQERLVRPSACYTNPQADLLGFSILRPDLHAHADKFGVARDPPIADCVKRLLAKPPPTHERAVALFTYFSTRLSDLTGNSLRQLQEGAFVPVPRKATSSSSEWADEKKTNRDGISSSSATKFEYVQPTACYLGSSTTYGNIFDFVDFGANANAFLFKCGSKSEPTKTEIARLACSEPARLLSTLQTPERYLNLLRSLAEDLPQLKTDRELFRQMKTAPFLLASREIGRPAAEADDEAPIRQYQLAPASKIAILDDYISYRLFKDKLMCAPEEDTLETFYLALGAQMLSQIVQEDIRIGAHSASQRDAVQLRTYVLERSKIFLYEYQKYRRDAIKHDHRWLEKHLAVEMVQSVALRRSLRGSGETHTEKRSAASTRTAAAGYVLYVSSQTRVDMYQVGQAVCQLVLNRPSQQAYFFFEPFLKLELLDLRARGYNVDRILRAKQAEARIAEEERRKALEAEQQRIREAETAWAQHGQQQQQRQPEQGTVAARADARTPEPKMPGAFDGNGSPEDMHHAQQQQQQHREKEQQVVQPPSMLANLGRRGKGGLFSNLTRRFGLDQSGGVEDQRTEDTAAAAAQHRHLQDFMPENGHAGGGGAGHEESASAGGGQMLPPGAGNDDGRVTSPAAVRQNMLNAIQATRPYGSASLFEPPKTNLVKEQATYCDSNHAHDLELVAQAPRGMPVFLARAVATPAATFLTAQRTAIAAFESLLGDVAAVYDLAPGVVHIYYDEVGPTIAFNTSGSIFCNLRYFLQLHADAVSAAQGRVDAAVWWWVVLAHELAHNLEPSHNSNHSYYTESFVQQYFQKMTGRAAVWMAAPSAAAAGDSAPSAPPSYQQATARGRPPTSLLD
ncbi:ATPase subunit c domain protein [Niveomyces insectorum RCEF 264]|uniref:ATPase subunit c domain protein n=1 Tax=Niveomyces insectorum RCEF 264 TaxID=1081102 RepID=A0A168AI44_9HYPO|nr:ATPase subunit c domain protein [Niveomyces insectorum RCEF 264]